MANELVVNVFTRRRFWKNVEQIQAKNTSLESLFFHNEGQLILFELMLRKSGYKLLHILLGSENGECV